MIDNNLFREISTNLELNGPNLSFTTQPVGVATTNNSSVTFIGIATATFPQASSNSGTIAYQWYDQNGAISNGTYVTGAATTTLTISNVISPTDSNRQIYLRADYVPSGVTGNALNEPTNSNVGILTVYPVLSITTQPVEITATTNFPATFSVVASSTDTSQGTLSYKWTLDGTDIVDSSTVSGSSTPNLIISNPNIDVFEIQARIINSSASNSPLYSNIVNFYNVPPAKNITIEKYDTTSSTITSSNTHDLLVSGDLTLLAQDNSSATSSISLYAPEMNINVEMEIYGGAGANSGSNTGGQGGFSKVRFTMNKNVEYTIAGLDSTNQCPFVYRKGSLIAVCGKGGDAASGNNGGAGGGINVAGASGGGSGGGSGGVKITTGTLTTNGIFGSSSSSTPISPDTKATGQTGGKTISCPKGNYWISRGYSACADVGTSQIYLANGTLVTNSALITRGFKSGYDIRQTAGLGQAQYSTQVPYTDTCYNTGGSSGYRWEMRYASYQTGVVDNAGSISYDEVRQSGPSGYAPQNVSGEINTTRTINGDDRYYTITATNGITQTNGYVESGFFTNTAYGQFVIGGIRVDSVSKVGDAKWEVRFRRNDNNLLTFNRQFIFTITGQQNFWVPYDDTYSNPYPCTQYRTVTVSGSGSGGSGATGGNGGTNSSGGGGGSGYTDGSVTVVSTQQGGNIGGAKIIIRAV